MVSGSCLGSKMSQFCWSFEVTKHQKRRIKVLAAQVQIFDALLQRSEELFQLFVADFALQCLVSSQVHNECGKKILSHTNFCLPTTQTSSLSFLVNPNDVQFQSGVFPVLQVPVWNQCHHCSAFLPAESLLHRVLLHTSQSSYTLGFISN